MIRCLFAIFKVSCFSFLLLPVLFLRGETVVSIPEALPSMMELYQKYVQANGGRANLQSIQSLKMTAELISSGDDTFNLTIYRKRPNMIRTQVVVGNRVRCNLFNGKTAWKINEVPGFADETIQLDEFETAVIARDSHIDGPFQLLQGREDWAIPAAFESIDGVPTIRIDVLPEANSPYDVIWLSLDNYQEIKLMRIQPRLEEGGTPETLEAYFSDYSKQNDVWFPLTIKAFKNGQWDQTIHVNSLRVNVGIFDSFFERREKSGR